MIRELRRVVYHPFICGPNAVACTWIDHHRTAVLAYDPAHGDVVRIAVSLHHEARHHETDVFGADTRVDHTCSDPWCSIPNERNVDPIYDEDERLQRRLEHALGRDQPSPAAVFFGAFAITFVAGIAGIALARASAARA